MRKLLIASLMVLAGHAIAQPGFGVGVDSGTSCHEVARQILHDWIDVKDLMGAQQSTKRPSASEFRCISPSSLQGAMPKRLGGTNLRCYSLGGTGACCDAEMQSCATL